MFFTLTSLRVLIIDADDFCTRPQVLTEIINTLDLVIKVVLVTRRNRVSPNLQSRTVCPEDILEHLDFKNLLKRTITDLKVPPASTVFLCSSTDTLELTKDLLLGTIVFIKHPLTDLEKHLLYQESPDFVVDSLDVLFKCLSTLDAGYAAEISSAPDRLIKSPYNYSSPITIASNQNNPNNKNQFNPSISAKPSINGENSSINGNNTSINGNNSSISGNNSSISANNSSITPSSTNAHPNTLPNAQTNTDFNVHPNARPSAHPNVSPLKTKTRIVKIPNLEHPDCPYYVMGRYFGPSDPRHQLHALSLRIWNFKKHHTPHQDLFADLFMRGIEAATGGAYDVITQVPSRPEVGDRLAHILSLMQSKPLTPLLMAPRHKTIPPKQLTETGEILPALILPEQIEQILPNKLVPNQLSPEHIVLKRIQPDILRCVKSYPPLKALNLQARKASIAKVFEVQKEIKGKRVVIIDDIVTTGATINACIAELKAAGAATVTPVLLAYHPYALKPRPDHSNHNCSECGERLGFAFEPSHIHFQCLGYTNENHSKLSFSQAINDRLNLLF